MTLEDGDHMNDPSIPPDIDAEAARKMLLALAPLDASRKLSLTIEDQEVPVPLSLVPVLIKAAELISEGHPIDVVATDNEVSAQEAAEFLKVSRPYLLNLVKKGILPCRMVGAHHRIPMGALIAYKHDQAPRRRSLEALSAETQDLGH